ncbi:hypothetical protein G8C92_30095 [Paenibacillus donghaensis]|uniref:hypothetical protein n=1 Tax=Paenibacillus donghaensis TaxID=414771 RepID=UPI0018843FFD|nr:hypothetical protein [Paenibacillus donghaensis]MBE9918253.1 hypothetical protein [Paenibacillus donghaensis]
MSAFLFWINVLRNAFVAFFQDGLWALAFFFLLHKTFENGKLMRVSKVVVTAVLVLLFLHAFFRSI